MDARCTRRRHKSSDDAAGNRHCRDIWECMYRRPIHPLAPADARRDARGDHLHRCRRFSGTCEDPRFLRGSAAPQRGAAVREFQLSRERRRVSQPRLRDGLRRRGDCSQAQLPPTSIDRRRGNLFSRRSSHRIAGQRRDLRRDHRRVARCKTVAPSAAVAPFKISPHSSFSADSARTPRCFDTRGNLPQARYWQHCYPSLCMYSQAPPSRGGRRSLSI